MLGVTKKQYILLYEGSSNLVTQLPSLVLVLVWKYLTEILVCLKFFIFKWRQTLLLNGLRCLDKNPHESEIYNKDKNMKIVIILKKEMNVNYSL